MLTDLRYALRSLTRNPGLTAAAVLCLALGIGANATMFGVVDALLLKPPAHVRDPDRMARLYFERTWPGMGPLTSDVTAYPSYSDFVGLSGFSGVAGVVPRILTLGRGAAARSVSASLVTPGYFGVLGVRPALGRFFVPEEERAAGPPVAVISDRFWRARFAGDSGVLGKTLEIGKRRATVVGVTPEGFLGLGLGATEVWLPIEGSGDEFLAPGWRTSRSFFFLLLFARLPDGVTVEQATEQATAAHRRGYADAPEADSRARVVLASLLPARGPNAPPEAKVALWLAGVATVVLLVACANVANLLLARGLQRRRELAVRLAIGASRARLARLLFAESLVLAAVGAAAALAVVAWGGAVVRGFLLPDPSLPRTSLDWRVVAFTVPVAVVTGVLCGLAPAVTATRHDLSAALKAGAREGGGTRSRTRAALLVGQVALTLVLLAGAGLFVRSLRNARALDLGMDVGRILLVNVDLASAGYDTAGVDAVYRRMLERATALPGVERASLATTAPFMSSFGYAVFIPGRDSLPRPKGGGPYANGVAADFFGTLGLRLVRGRVFTPSDRNAIVVSETMAKLYWPGEDAVGKCLKLLDPAELCRDVIGVVRDTPRFSIREEAAGQIYVPLDQLPKSTMRALFVRVTGDPHSTAPAVQRALQTTAPDLPFVDVFPLQNMLDSQFRPWRMGATTFSAFGALALALAAVGLYGVIAYTVAQRAQELGIRMALGAQTADVLRLVVGQGLRVTALGVALGVAGALAAGRAAAALLFGVRPYDPLVLAACAATLLVVSALASYLPARRATRVDPATALRAE